jgi:hypothetical protein
MTRISLPENRRRLKGLGVEHAKNQSFDNGYTAGWDASNTYLRNIIAVQIELACQQASDDGTHDNNMKCTCNIAASIARGC